MEEKKEIRKKIFKARKEHSDEWEKEMDVFKKGEYYG